MIEVRRCVWEDLSKEERSFFIFGEDEEYLRVSYDGVTDTLVTMRAEPEDKMLCRNYGWIMTLIADAYKRGVDDGRKNV